MVRLKMQLFQSAATDVVVGGCWDGGDGFFVNHHSSALQSNAVLGFNLRAH
jgi:hypothetical protein